jgi:sugar/nucleoside kinase (ribokinase family)
VNDLNKNTIAEIVAHLEQNSLIGPNAFLGFDACIDIIVRIVSGENENEIPEYFTESSKFGEFLMNLNNKSAGVELHTKLSKPGGNMVITGNALGKLGVKVECVGTFGLPEILPVFRAMSENCSLHTIGDTISATALEFDNSKVIMFDPGPYNSLTWQDIKDILDIEKIKQLVEGKQLVSFLNWSEIENSSEIWDGFLRDVLPFVELQGHLPYFFSDFSDCSRKSKQDIQLAVNLLGRFRNYFKVTLSLNQNEAALIAKALDLEDHNSDEEFIQKLYRLTNTDILVIHRTNDALAYNGIDYEKSDTFFCKEPKILTGGGDNFNAGFCYALFHKLNLAQSLIVANAVSGSYVKNGISPDADHLIEFLEQETKKVEIH